MNSKASEGAKRDSLKGFEEPLFDFERDFLPTAEQINGPVSSFIYQNKEKILKDATSTGIIASNFQDCGPFTDREQKAIRQELVALRGISNIFADTFSSSLEELNPEHLAFRFYGDRAIHEAVLVEASRRAYLEQGGRNENFNRSMIQKSQEAIYPSIDRELALDSLGLFHSRIMRILESDLPITGFAQGVLERHTFFNEAVNREPISLKPEVMDEIKSLLDARYKDLFRDLREEFKEISNDNLVEVTKRIFEILGHIDKGWKVIDARDTRTGFSVIPQDMVFEVGNRSKKINWDGFESLMIHEDSHIERGNNARDAGHKSLALGWLGYESSEEGLAMLKEKCWTGEASKNTSITRDHYRYILAAYATGALDGNKHGIQDTFVFAVNLNTISRAAKIKKTNHIKLNTIEKAARAQMGEHIYRLFRGMPDGIALLKDVIYLDGYTKEVISFNKTDNVAGRLNKIMRGKHNDADKLQVATLDSIYGR
jgi:hypothetical protein